jgi:hypothetical protein
VPPKIIIIDQGLVWFEFVGHGFPIVPAPFVERVIFSSALEILT